jgi:hypothetical protein
MKPYLARLASRAIEARDFAPALTGPVADPFTETAGPVPAAVPDASPSGDLLPVMSRPVPPESSLPAAADEFGASSSLNAVEPASPAEPAVFSPPASDGMFTTPVKPLGPRTENIGDAPAVKLKDDPIEAAADTGDVPVVALPPAGKREAEATPAEPPAAEPAAELEDELLRLADAFMAGIRGDFAGRSFKPTVDDEPPSLAPVDAVAHSARTSPPEPQPVPTVHIGSLRVEVVQAAPPGPSITSASRPSVRRAIPRPGGGGNPARSVFGLRQI